MESHKRSFLTRALARPADAGSLGDGFALAISKRSDQRSYHDQVACVRLNAVAARGTSGRGDNSLDPARSPTPGAGDTEEIMAKQYGRLDQWSKTAAIDVAKAREMAARLEHRGRSADEVAARNAYLTLLGIRPGERVLEVGCGSGVVLRDLARRVAPNGLALGLDPSPAFLAIARELAVEAGLGQSIELREGDARALPFGAAEFDTALAHIPDGRRAIPELVRVVRPGGRVGIFERDTDSYIVAHPDRELTRQIVAAQSDHGSADGWLARALPRLMAEAGLRDVQVRAFTSIETDPAGFYSLRAERSADTAVSAGVISAEERRRWLDALAAERASGGFIAGLTLLFAWGTRAEGPAA